MRWLPGLLMISALFVIATTAMLVPTAKGVPQNLTEHSWIYNQGYMDDMRIYQTEAGFRGQKLVTGTRGSGTVSRTIDAEVYGGWGSLDEISMSEWGVYQNKPSSTYAPSLTQSDLRNALCAKNYETGSVYSESYSNLVDLVKDTSIIQTNEVSVYDIKSEVQGTAKIGARVQKSASTVPAYVMGGTYMGYTNIHMSLETGNASVLTLPCP
ncbi:MAG: hypothetical protein NTV25_03860 [Methanothrix sp.]|nr:hypothetical protein [Methanothrix sp.]